MKPHSDSWAMTLVSSKALAFNICICYNKDMATTTSHQFNPNVPANKHGNIADVAYLFS
jgi:hypothetical protein